MWITALKVTPDIDDYAVHQCVYRLFSKSTEVMGRTFCYRRAGDRVLIYSMGRVNENSWWFEFEKGRAYDFSMIACPGRGTYRDKSGKRRRMRPRTNIEDVFSWLERRVGDTAEVDALSGKRIHNRRVHRPCGQIMTWPCWLLSGVITVRQPKSLETILQTGVGQGVPFGMGLMFIPEAICKH